MRIIRVFPRRTNATPDDDLAVVNRPPGFWDKADEVHISVSFTWDLPLAEMLEKLWKPVGPVKIGGPATGEPGGDFIPGMYLREGYVITSRGCPNRCWFCSVPAREGFGVRELPITQGYNLLDDNLLACSDQHIRDVFAMLACQKERVQFTGGLEAARLKSWHVEKLRELHPKQLFFAYDTSDDLDPLRSAGKMLLEAGFTRESHTLRCYVLCGYRGDTFESATIRMNQAVAAGFIPMAMLFRPFNAYINPNWVRWQREWARPCIIASRMREAA